MDTFASSLKSALNSDSTTGPGPSGECVSPHAKLYKMKKTPGSQEQRRKILLEEQKKRRSDCISGKRNTATTSESEDEDEKWTMDPTEEKIRKGRLFNNDKLMYPEWLLEVPSDFRDNWVTKICPVGERMFLLCRKGKTTALTNVGIVRDSFQSAIPGGNRSNNRDLWFLDCIFCSQENIYYLLDVLCWSVFISDSDTDFRFSSLDEQLSPIADMGIVSPLNQYKLVLLPSYSYNDLREALTTTPMFTVDGLMFYHRGTSYTPGKTPLVGWLKPYMVSEVLSLPVCDYYNSTRPEDYMDFRTEIKKLLQETEEGKVNNL